MDGWRYSRDSSGAFREYGSWTGEQVPRLKLHFHSEAQLSAVVRGWRAIRVGAEIFAIGPGECLYIPPECPHQALPTVHPETWCVNGYAPAAAFGDLPKVLRFERPLPGRSLPGRVSPAALFSSLGPGPGRDAPPAGLAPEGASRRFCPTGRIAEIAARCGVSREHFSRRFRRDFGISPYAYSLIARLNEARRRLRMGQPIAAVAADLGFADQSHFGRLFRATYGTTPRQYRLGVG